MHRFVFLVIAAAALARGFGAEATNSPLLSLDRLFDSAEFNGASVPEIVWSKRAGYYSFEKSTNDGGGQDFVWRDPEADKPEIVVPSHAFAMPGGGGKLAVESWQLAEDESKLLVFTNGRKVWRANTRGDYWVLDLTSRELRKLGGDAPASSLMFAAFSPDGKKAAFVRENDLWVQNLRDLSLARLTTNGSPTVINGTFDWVYEEELHLRQGFQWSPDSGSIAYWQLDASGVREFQMLNNTDGFYPRAHVFAYPKTGELNSAARIGVAGAAGGPTRWMELPGDPREHYLARMCWASNSTELLIQQFNRAQNTNTVWLADARSGEARVLLAETDPAWVENDNAIRWIDSGRSFLWLSERSGWRQIYRASKDGRKLARLTKDEFDVMEIEHVDEAGGFIYFTASPEAASEQHLYRIPIGGGRAARVSPELAGTHSYRFSADGRWAVHSFSTFTNPPVTTLVRMPSHETARKIEANEELKKKLQGLSAPAAEFFQVEIEGGAKLDAWALKPPGFSEQRKYPLIIYVYGETAGQTVLNRWLGKRQLWHWMLAQQGYVVMSFDNRGTPAPKGRAWRRALHRQIGILNAADQAAALRAVLKDRAYLDPARVAIWGWSGGGSSTLNALFQYPNLYKTGISVAPVANQRHYDTIYQERYMGLPEENVDGYRRGSPLAHARNLAGNLLLIHGTGDDNVHYQGTEALINDLIAWNKSFSMMAYPNRTHSVSEGKNTTRHLYALMTRFLTTHVPVETTVLTNEPPRIAAGQ